MARYLLEQGVDRDKAGKYDSTPLHVAACKGHLDFVRLLVEQGVKKDKINYLGIARNNHVQVVLYLLQQEAGKDRIDDADYDGNTLLHWAIKEGKG